MRSVMRPEYSRQPATKVQRAAFDLSCGRKITFDAGLLVPIRVWEVLPGDVWRVRTSALCRLATALFPLMDNLKLTIHFWSASNRILWDNWRKFCGERDDPSDSIDYTVPARTITPLLNSLADYFALPVGNEITGVCDLPFRMYNFVYNEHYRNQSLIDSLEHNTADSVLPGGNYTVQRRGKRADYFTRCLPSPQKGDAVTLPLGTSAPIEGIGIDQPSANANSNVTVRETDGTTPTYAWTTDSTAGLASVYIETEASAGGDPQIFANLSDATAATIIEFRQAVAVQQHLEMDSRGGSRYPEILWSQFGTEFQDLRYRPEYLGGGTVDVNISPIANQSGSSGDVGDLAAIGTARADNIGFTKAFDEHGWIMAIACVDADLTYQYGLDKMWSRSTRFDFFYPSFAFIGDQAVLSKEIYADGTAGDENVFGYAPRHEEYRWCRSEITGLFRSNAAGTLDPWHCAEANVSRPTLGQTWFESNPPLDRNIAVPTEPHFIGDFYFDIQAARPVPLNGVPGMTRI